MPLCDLESGRIADLCNSERNDIRYEPIDSLGVNEAILDSFLASTSRLLRLLLELLAVILRHIPFELLSNFTLVLNPCRALARSRQFAHVTIDGSQRSMSLLSRFAREILQRLNNENTKLPCISACVRKLSIDSKSEYLQARGFGVDHL